MFLPFILFMRRKDRAISEEESIVILKNAEYGYLSLASHECKPYGIPLNYCIIDDSIYFHCASDGMKLDIIAQNNSVSFCVVGKTKVLPSKFGTEYESIIVFGSTIEVSDNEKQLALEGLLTKYSPDYFQKGLEMIKINFGITKVFRIKMHSLSGKACR